MRAYKDNLLGKFGDDGSDGFGLASYKSKYNY